MIHRHRFTETQRVYAAPTMTQFKGDRLTQEAVDRWLFGITTIISKCDCGRISTTEVLGDARLKTRERLKPTTEADA